MIDFLYGFVKGQASWLQWLLFIAATVIGFVVLVKCADIFVDAASNIAHIFKIPAILVGLTIVAFGTSAPEFSISIMAAMSGSEGISIGNITGSVMFNLYVVLAVSALIAPVAIKHGSSFRQNYYLILQGINLLRLLEEIGSSLLITVQNVLGTDLERNRCQFVICRDFEIHYLMTFLTGNGRLQINGVNLTTVEGVAVVQGIGLILNTNDFY